jgi:hypothetical protein
MRTLKLLSFGLLILSATVFTSCKKKGCTDMDADNYSSSAEKSDGSCSFRYGKTVSVITPSSVNYDPLDAPDLFIRFAKKTSSQWDYTTPVVSDSYTFTANFPNEYLFTNEQWDYEVYDQDTFDADDLVCSGSFNPLEDGSDGKIVIFNGGSEIQFPYTTK